MKKIIRALKLAKIYWRSFLFLAVLILILSAGKQVPPLMTKQIIDSLQASIANSVGLKEGIIAMSPYLAAYLASLMILAIANRLSWHHSTILNIKLQKLYTEIGYEKLLSNDVKYFDSNVSGSLMSKLERGVRRLTGQVTNATVFFLPNILSTLIAMIVIASIEPLILVGLIIALAPYIAINLAVLKKSEPYEKRYNKIWDKESGHFYEVVSSMRLVKSFNTGKKEWKKMSKTFDRLVNLQKRIEKLWDWTLSKDILIEGTSWLVVFYVVVLALTQSISLGTLFLLVSYLGMLKEPFWQISWIYFEIRRTLLGAIDYFKILDSKSDIRDPKNPVRLESIKGKIEFRNVDFSYPKTKGNKKNEKVIDRMSFIVKDGETVALVARSGGGKTTIANLINRFYDVDSGKILLDGINIKNLNQSFLRKNIGLVLQDSYLFDQTIEENLRYGRQNVSEAEIKAACEAANAWEFIEKLPKGIKTEIGERGIKLSGGQKQRLSIARTLLKNPPILILDEATSSLDSESEMKVQQAIWKLIKGRTAIIIAHRLSTIQRADRILVLDGGKVTEQGTHKQLIRKKGIYASLNDIQTGKKKLKEFELIA